MHTPGAHLATTMHPSIISYVLFYINIFILLNMIYVYMPVAQGLKSMHPSAKMCTLSAGCTLDHEHRDNERFSVQCIHNGFMKLNFAFLAVGITLVYERYK